MKTSRSAIASSNYFAASMFGIALLTVSISAMAQSFVSGPDRLLNRLCTNSCMQAGEELAADSNGNAISIWAEEGKRIVTASFNASTGTWAASQTRFTGAIDGTPSIFFDGNGNALAIWATTNPDSSKQAWFARYSGAQSAWASPAKAFTIGLYDSLGGLSGSKNGNAIVQINGLFGADSTKGFDAATSTWGSGGLVGDQVVLDPAGNAFAIYNVQGSSYDAQFYVKRFDAATKQYTDRIQLDQFTYNYTEDENGNAVETSGGFRAASVTVDAYGNAMVLWTKSVTTEVRDGDKVLSRKTVDTVKSARYLLNKNSWVAKSIPALSSGKMVNVSLSADRFANVNAVWTQYVGPYAKVVSARYTSANGAWSMPRVIQHGQFNTRDAGIATDPQGNVFAKWSQRTDSGTDSGIGKIFRTNAARYNSTTGTWGAPATIQDANLNGYDAALTVDNKGRALLMWTQDSGNTRPDGSPIKEIRSDRLIPQ